MDYDAATYRIVELRHDNVAIEGAQGSNISRT